MIKLGSNIAAMQAQRKLGQSTTMLGRALERLSSGLRINHAADDAAGLAVASGLNAEARVAAQGLRNLNDSISLLQIAKGALDAMSAILMRQQELSAQAANGSYSTTQREALDAEARALTAEYNRIVESTEFNGLQLLAKAGQEFTIQAGAGEENALKFSLGGQLAMQTGFLDAHIFYNNSYFDGYNSGADWQDDLALAPDKEALLPGGTTTFANYSSYEKGLNGIMIDIANLPQESLDASDFTFLMGNDANPGGWGAAPAPESITVRPGAGLNGSDRVELIWANGVIMTNWLQVTVAANEHTGLNEAAVFYFGIATGESGDSTTNALVNFVDELAARANLTDSATVTNRFDYNRDSLVNIADEQVVLDNLTNPFTSLRLLTMPAGTTSAQEYSTFIDDLDLTSAHSARVAMDVLEDRLERVGLEIGALGAVESRFNSAVNLLISSRDSRLQAASRIMDADVAEEAAMLVRSQILQQVGAAVLAQANIQPSLALSLLAGS
jgi:flagellin-like hook-associated protein FlgL